MESSHKAAGAAEAFRTRHGSTFRRIAWAVLRMVVVLYAGIAVLLFFLQSKLVYHPRREIDATPDSVALAYEDVSFRTADGVNLAGWFVPAEKPKGVLLFCHGNAGNISHRLESILVFHRLQLSVFLFDYRGYGRSEGKPTEQGTYLDAEAAWDYLAAERGVRPDETIVFGRSLGAAVASRLARDRTPGALIVESAFTSAADLGRELFWFLPARWMVRFDYDTREHVRGVKCPVLIVHSREDDLIPFHHGQAIFQAAPEPKEFLEIHGSHNSGFWDSREQYTRAVGSFLSDHLGSWR